MAATPTLRFKKVNQHRKTIQLLGGYRTRIKGMARENRVMAATVRKSMHAYQELLQKYPPVQLQPEHGPVDRIDPPELPGEMIPNKYHVVVAAGCNAYQAWQMLTHYHRYKQLLEKHPDSPMGGYTRLLHCSHPDEIMHMLPTALVSVLPNDIVKGYSPINRSWGYVQWLARYPVREQYIMMSDPDHLFMVPPPLIATPTRLVTAAFSYIKCTDEQHREACQNPRYNPNGARVEDVPPIGSSPMIMSRDMMLELVPLWDTILRAIHAEVPQKFGWVQEMYAFALAAARPEGEPSIVQTVSCLMVHPPYKFDLLIDSEKDPGAIPCKQGDERHVPFSILHYTYGVRYDEKYNLLPLDSKELWWQFDKREYMKRSPPVPLPVPDGVPEAMKVLIAAVNEAGANPEWSAWWRAVSQTQR